MNEFNFHKCSCCDYIWQSLDSFLNDDSKELIGYQVNFKELQLGWFLFNHSCGTTFAVQVKHFLQLYDGPVFKERLTGKEQCSTYCLNKNELRSCPAKCECAYVREIMQIIKSYNKQKTNSYSNKIHSTAISG